MVNKKILTATLIAMVTLFILGIITLDNNVAFNSQAQIYITASPACTPQDIEFSDGNYRSGDNFPSGTYDIITVKGNGNILVDGRIVKHKNITLNKGTMLRIDGTTIKLHLVK